MEKPVVVKIGGSLQGEGAQALSSGLALALLQRRPVVVVHGGGPRISAALADAHIHLPFVDGLRVTTAEAMDVVEKVLCDEVNDEIAGALDDTGYPVCRFTSRDAVLIGESLPGMERTGQITEVNPAPLQAALHEGRIPILAPLAVDQAGLRYNINADLAAAAVAGALGASHIVYLTDVAGIYEDFGAGKLIHRTDAQALADLMAEGCFSQGMIPKVNAVLSALAAGVGRAYVIDGRNTEAVVCAMGNQDLAQGTLVIQTEEVA